MEMLRKYSKILIIAPLILLTGCSNNIETIEPTATTAIEVVQSTALLQYDEFKDLDPADIENAKFSYEISQKELAEMDIYSIKCFIAKNYGDNFRDHFKISENTALTDEDFLNLKAFIYFELFNSFVYTDENGNETMLLDTTDGINIMKEVTDEHFNDLELQVAKESQEVTDGQIETEEPSETKEEFINHLFEETKEKYCQTPEDEEAYMAILNGLSDEEIAELMQKY